MLYQPGLSIDICYAAGSRPHATAAVDRRDRQTDGWTPDCYTNPSSAYYAVSVNKCIKCDLIRTALCNRLRTQGEIEFQAQVADMFAYQYWNYIRVCGQPKRGNGRPPSSTNYDIPWYQCLNAAAHYRPTVSAGALCPGFPVFSADTRSVNHHTCHTAFPVQPFWPTD